MPSLPANIKLILASSSPYRRELLSRLHLDFSCQSPQIDETPLDGEKPQAYVQRLAREKASKIAQEHPQAWVIGSDQCAVLKHKILGKPVTLERAKSQLLACSGQEVSFLTAYCLLVPQKPSDIAIDITRVRFRSISESEIERYLATEDVLSCAGSFKVEALGVSLFEAVESTDPTALIGLPLIGLCKQLRSAGAQVP